MGIHVDLTASPRAAGQARALVASALDGAEPHAVDGDTLHTAQLIASELVTNAVLHARTDLHLGLSHDGHALLIAVADRAPAVDGIANGATRYEGDPDESGRGMLIVASLASDFGWRSRDDMPGKVMWVLLELDGESVTASAADR